MNRFLQDFEKFWKVLIKPFKNINFDWLRDWLRNVSVTSRQIVNDNKSLKVLIPLFVLALIIVIIMYLPKPAPTATPEPTTAPTATAEPTLASTATPAPTTTPTATPAPTLAPTTKPEIQKKIDNALKKKGWKDKDLKKGKDIDISKDKSKAGHGSYTYSGTRTPSESINFLFGRSPNGTAALNASLILARSTKSEMADASNWSSGQSTIVFYYAGNTSIHNGIVTYSGVRKGYPGEMLTFFASPSSGAVLCFRGPCGNLQLVLPSPKDPSKDPAALVKKIMDSIGGKNDTKGPGKAIPKDKMADTTSVPRVDPTPKVVVITPVPKGTQVPKTTPAPIPSPEPGEGTGNVNTGTV
ncbi:MAG: hypothetical protein WCI79_00245 [Candidatus Saccharibacteria bacterium]